jgi:hypothetical protein
VPCSGDDCLDYWTRAGGALLERFVEPGVEHPTRLATWSLDLSARSTCTELGLETWMPGRAGRLTTPLTCVRPMQAVEREAQELPLDVVKGRVMSPSTASAVGFSWPPRSGLLLEERAGVPLTYVQAAAGPSGWLVRPAGLPLVPARETLLDFVAFPRATTDGGRGVAGDRHQLDGDHRPHPPYRASCDARRAAGGPERGRALHSEARMRPHAL